MNPHKCAFGVSAGQFLGFLVREREIEIGPRSIESIKKIQPHMNKKELQSLVGKIIKDDKCFYTTIKIKSRSEVYMGARASEGT